MCMNFLVSLLAAVTVHTATLETIENDAPIVTNVTATVDIDTNGVKAISGEVTSNVVTKAYVEDLGISAGLTTNDVDSIIASSNLISSTDAKAYTDGKFNLNNPNLVSVVESATLTNKGAKAYADAANADTRSVVATWESFLDGSNVVFSITNYISGTYSTDYAKLRILELRDGIYAEVYSSHQDIQNHINLFKTNDFRIATNQVIQTVNAKVDGKADKAWGKYSSGGVDLQSLEISNTVYMTAAHTVFAGGLEFERVVVGSGAIGVLTTKGAAAYTQGDAGTFKIQDATSTNYFGYSKTDDYIIGCNTDGITTSGGMVTLEYDIISSSYPIIYYMETLENYNPANWEQLNDSSGEPIAGASHAITWDTSVPEKFYAMIDCSGQAKGFFMANITVVGDASFETNMKAKFTRGILCTDGQHTIKFDYNGGNPRLIVGE